MPKPYPREFREDVVAVARERGPGVPLREVAADFGDADLFGVRQEARQGPPARATVFEDRVQRAFTASTPNELWLTDITEHRTGEGKLHLCAVKDVCSNRIVGYSISDRMRSSLAVAAVENAVARRGDAAGCVVHSDRGSQFRSRRFGHALNRHGLVGSMGRVGAAGDNAAMESFFALLQK